jgi:hypothetical protein
MLLDDAGQEPFCLVVDYERCAHLSFTAPEETSLFQTQKFGIFGVPAGFEPDLISLVGIALKCLEWASRRAFCHKVFQSSV